MLRNLLTEVGATGALSGIILVILPQHPVAAIAAVVVAWVGFQFTCAFAFMKALYHGDIVEYRTEPRSYAVAPHITVSPLARRFLVSYLRVAKPRPSPATVGVELPRSIKAIARPRTSSRRLDVLCSSRSTPSLESSLRHCWKFSVDYLREP